MLNFKEAIGKIPKSLPRIEIEKLPEKEIELLIKGDPSFLSRFQFGDEYIWCDYDYPSKKLSQVSLCQVGGPMLVNGEETFELWIRGFTPKGERTDESWWYHAVKGEKVDTLLFINKDRQGKGKVEGTESEFPLRVKTSQRWESKQIYHTGRLRREYESEEKVDGPYLVRLRETKEECIRWLMTGQGGGKRDLAEAFISINSGVTFLFRRYNGPGWDNLKKLKESPKLTYEGEGYFLWYCSVPFREV